VAKKKYPISHDGKTGSVFRQVVGCNNYASKSPFSDGSSSEGRMIPIQYPHPAFGRSLAGPFFCCWFRSRVARRTQGAPARPDGASARGAWSGGGRRRAAEKAAAASGYIGSRLHPQEASAQVVPGASDARADHCLWSNGLRLLRLEQACQARRGRDETLDVVPRQWKVVQHVREKFTCRDTSFLGLPMIETFYGVSFLGVGILIDQLGTYVVLSTLRIIVAVMYSSSQADSVCVSSVITAPR
jgi:hypothetical protein